jgi:hypothetical protein
MGAFAHAVIRSQPGDYVRAVMIDIARYVAPGLDGNRAFSGQPREILSFGWRDKEVESLVVRAMSWKYRGSEVHARALGALALYQDIMRVHGWMILALAVLTGVGMCIAEATIRFLTWTFGVAALGLFALPAATISYDFRYGIPPETFLVVSGVMGAVALARRLRTPASSAVADLVSR